MSNRNPKIGYVGPVDVTNEHRRTSRVHGHIGVAVQYDGLSGTPVDTVVMTVDQGIELATNILAAVKIVRDADGRWAEQS